jgi:hypothetical protein
LFGTPWSPTTIEFGSGRSLKVWYTNDRGGFYLRKVEGPEGLTRRLTVEPYKEIELKPRKGRVAAAATRTGVTGSETGDDENVDEKKE